MPSRGAVLTDRGRSPVFYRGKAWKFIDVKLAHAESSDLRWQFGNTATDANRWLRFSCAFAGNPIGDSFQIQVVQNAFAWENYKRVVSRKFVAGLHKMVATIDQKSFFERFPTHAFDERSDGSWMSDIDRRVLLALVRNTPCRHLMEFGVREGGTAEFLLRNCLGVESYIGIDVPKNFVPTLEIQKDEWVEDTGFRVKDLRFQLLVIPEGTAGLSVSEFGSTDFVFIDADHSRECVLRDTRLAHALIKTTGVIAWHDYGVSCVEVSEALNYLCECERRSIVHVAGTTICYESILRTAPSNIGH